MASQKSKTSTDEKSILFYLAPFFYPGLNPLQVNYSSLLKLQKNHHTKEHMLNISLLKNFSSIIFRGSCIMQYCILFPIIQRTVYPGKVQFFANLYFLSLSQRFHNNPHISDNHGSIGLTFCLETL